MFSHSPLIIKLILYSFPGLRELTVLVVARREKREKEAATRPEKEGRFMC
jgi:hypothetical protein